MSSAHPTSIEERRRLVTESLQVGNPASRSKDLPEQADPRHDCQIEVRVDEIRPYERNPRRANNAKFAEIKESIRATGIRNPLTVTRRPGEKHFIVEAGGNTRLLAAQQLWAETRDPRFEKLTVIFRPWRSEGHVLVAHLIENEQRGDMTFWDKANGVVALKAKLEEEKGRTLSLRQLEEELKTAGFSVNTATLAQYLYASTRLSILGDEIASLCLQDVKTIQPRLNLLKRYAQVRGVMEEAALYAAICEPVFRRYASRYRESGTFSATELCQACEDMLARQLGEDPARFRMVLDALSHSAHVTSLETLLVMGPGSEKTGVSGANREAEQARRHDTLVDRLKASIGRFARLAVQRGVEERARVLLPFVCGLLDETVRAQLAETPSLTPADCRASIGMDGEFLNWLLDGRDDSAAAFWEVAALVRDLRSRSQ